MSDALLQEGASAVLPHARSILERGFPLRVLVLGDSVAAGVAATSYRRAFPWLWANHLRQKHGSPVHLVNLSQAGLTSRFGVEIAEPAAGEFQPDVVLVEFGLNDQRRGERSWRRPGSWGQSVQVCVDEFETNIGKIADRVRRRSGADVILVTPCPLPGRPGLESYRNAIVKVTTQTEFVLADVMAAWPDDAAGLLDAEGEHPNDAGHRIYAETLCGLGL
jgi:lysophospholipase L1-like esterase